MFSVKQIGGVSLIIITVTSIFIASAGTFAYLKFKPQNTTSLTSPMGSALHTASASAQIATPTPTATPSATPTAKPIPTTAPKPAAPIISAPPSSGYARVTAQTERGSFSADVVTISASSQMITDTASDSDCADSCPTIPLSDYVARNGGFAGINGTYFCPAAYPDCQSKKDSFDFPVYNSRLKKWINADKLGWNGRSIVYRDGSGMHYMQNSNGFSGGLEAGIINYPGILNNGHITVEAPSLSAKQSSKGTKGGIGFNESKIFLVIAYNVDMYDFAEMFKSFGAKYALNLDGGGSIALYYNGYKAGPGRNLPNAIVFK